MHGGLGMSAGYPPSRRYTTAYENGELIERINETLVSIDFENLSFSRDLAD